MRIVRRLSSLRDISVSSRTNRHWEISAALNDLFTDEDILMQAQLQSCKRGTRLPSLQIAWRFGLCTLFLSGLAIRPLAAQSLSALPDDSSSIGKNVVPLETGQDSMHVSIPAWIGPDKSPDRSAPGREPSSPNPARLSSTTTSSAASSPFRVASSINVGPDTSSSKVSGDENAIGSPQMVEWLTQLVRENLPEDYEDTKKWGHQKEVWDGVDVSRDGLKIKTKRKHKLVNDGTWTRYRLSMVEPDKNLHILFHRLEALPDGRIAFDVSVEMLLDVFGRLSQWVRDVQLISLSANADAVCSMRTTGTVAVRMNPLKLPPDIIVQPHVETAVITIHEFRVRRISQVGGPAAKHLGDGLKHVLDEKLEDANQKLPEKINRGFAKHEDKMTFSLQDWLRSKLPMPDSTAEK